MEPTQVAEFWLRIVNSANVTKKTTKISGLRKKDNKDFKNNIIVIFLK